MSECDFVLVRSIVVTYFRKWNFSQQLCQVLIYSSCHRKDFREATVLHFLLEYFKIQASLHFNGLFTETKTSDCVEIRDSGCTCVMSWTMTCVYRLKGILCWHLIRWIGHGALTVLVRGFSEFWKVQNGFCLRNNPASASSLRNRRLSGDFSAIWREFVRESCEIEWTNNCCNELWIVLNQG